MRKWGILITAFYALIVVGLLVPGGVFLIQGRFSEWPGFYEILRKTYALGDRGIPLAIWIPIAVVISGQALRRLRPPSILLIRHGHRSVEPTRLPR